MSISVVNRKFLWGRAGNRCAFPDCIQDLTIDLKTEESNLLSQIGVVMGEEAHIRSGQNGGPRYDPKYDKVDSYENLILLCPTHHTLIDKNSGVGFSTDTLLEMKRRHEREVTDKLAPELRTHRQATERMTALLSLWEDRAGIDRWQDLSSALNDPIPRLGESQYSLLFQAGHWMLSMRWPTQFPKTVGALKAFENVLTDLTNHLDSCMAHDGHFFRRLQREYKRIGWDPVAYKELFAVFQVERNLIYALVIEATKSINWVIAAASEEVDELFRFDKGVALMGDGDGLIRSVVVRLEYTDQETELENGPYPGASAIRTYLEKKVAESSFYFDEHHVSEAIDYARKTQSPD